MRITEDISNLNVKSLMCVVRAAPETGTSNILAAPILGPDPKADDSPEPSAEMKGGPDDSYLPVTTEASPQRYSADSNTNRATYHSSNTANARSPLTQVPQANDSLPKSRELGRGGPADISSRRVNSPGQPDHMNSDREYEHIGGGDDGERVVGRTPRHATDAGVRLAGGRPGVELPIQDEEEDDVEDDTSSTLPPPYREVRFSH